ncbi:MAG: choice-of-anchor U domain-containing protein [Pseudomonadota bacterium]
MTTKTVFYSDKTGLSVFGLLSLVLIISFFFIGPARAAVTYNGSSGIASLLSDGGCSGCHGAATPVACTGTALQTAWMDTTNASEARTSVQSCFSDLVDKISSSPSYGVRMPDGGPFYTSGEEAVFNQWDNDGYLLQAAPVTTTNNEDLVTNSSARLNSSTHPNGTTTTVTFRYALNVGLTSSAVTTSGSNIGSGGNGSAVSSSRTISGLNCGTTYYFRAQASNTSGSDNGSTTSLNTSACSNPTISVSGAGSSAGNRIQVQKGTTFTQTSVTFLTGDVDTSVNAWTINQPGAGSITGINTSTGAFTFNAPATAQNTSFTVSVTDSDPATGGGANTSSLVTVFVEVIDNAPEFRTAAFPGGSVITTDSLTVSEGNGSTPSQLINMFAYDADLDTLNWSVFTAPTRGTLSALANPTGTTNSITYTPNADVDINDSFVIRIDDGNATNDLTVTAVVTPVDDNPVAVADGPITFDIGVPVLIPVLSNDFDVDTGDVVSINAPSITGVTAGAAAVVMGNQIQYTSATSAAAAVNDNFQYGVIDDSPSMLTSGLATVSLQPRDTDLDTIPDYIDNCPGTANTAQTNTDGVPLANGNNTTDPGGTLGGDACDNDDDDDLITDVDELAYSMDPLDPSDALLDNDGDGISNLDEINTFMTNPNLANLAIDATGYWTSVDLTPPSPTEIHLDATAVRPSDPGPYRPGDNTIKWIPSNSIDSDLSLPDVGDPRLISNPPTQPLIIRPLVNFAADQNVESGLVTVELTMNGDSPSWPGTPVTVNYSVGGTADNPADHDAVSGSVLFNDTEYSRQITFTVVNDGAGDPDETVVFTIDSITNGAMGTKNVHTVTLIEGNVAPEVDIQFMQGGSEVGSAFDGAGNISINAIATDVNTPAQTLSYDWSGSDVSLTNPGNSPNWVAFAPPANGNYLIDVVVTDDGVPVRSTRVSRILNVATGGAAMPDADADGIPDSVDPFDSSAGTGDPSNMSLIPDQTVDAPSSFIVETEPGLKITTGNTAKAASSFGVLLTDSDISNFGSVTGTPPVNPNDSLSHVGGIYDFEVTGLIQGSSVQVVIPLVSSIPRNAVYRKFNPAIGWSAFVEDANNAVASAPGAPGVCPEPGSSDYRSGLNYLDNCIQLTIQDGGPNDTDNLANGKVADPGTIGIGLTEPVLFDEVEDGGGRMSSVLLIILMLIGVLRLWRSLKSGQLRFGD